MGVCVCCILDIMKKLQLEIRKWYEHLIKPTKLSFSNDQDKLIHYYSFS